MNPTRRTFLKTSLAAGAATTLASLSATSAHAASAPAGGRDFYEIRAYRRKPPSREGTHIQVGDKTMANPNAGKLVGADASDTLIHEYLEKALVPALNARGIASVGVFTEVEVDKKAVTLKPKGGTPESPIAVWVLIVHPTLESFLKVSVDLNADPAVQKAAADYFTVAKATPAYDRVDTWLLRSFAGYPKTQIPAFSKSKVPTRVFEMRDYESHSEERALSKMAMFNDGEIQVMKDLGMSPVFFGQAIAGPNLPHLRYITCAADLATHLDNWKKFGPHPVWMKMKDEPQYKNNTSKNTARFLVPTAYSQI
jgi:hypothetical protein